MKIYKKEVKFSGYDYEGAIYLIPHLNGCDDLKKFMVSLESICGRITEITVERRISGDLYTVYEKYDCFLDFLDNFHLQDIQEYNLYEFSSKDQRRNFKTHCYIDTIEYTIYLYKRYLNGAVINSYDYYQFKDGMIVRMEKNSGNCYVLTHDKRWELDYSLQDRICDAAYEMVSIDDPLAGMGGLYENLYDEKTADRMKYYRQFAEEINIVDAM